jgi:hypothetical protein
MTISTDSKAVPHPGASNKIPLFYRCNYKLNGWSGPAFGYFAIHTWHFENTNGQTTFRAEEGMEGWLVSLLKSRFQSGLDESIVHWLNYLKTQSEAD